jgi:hypothetical protein
MEVIRGGELGPLMLMLVLALAVGLDVGSPEADAFHRILYPQANGAEHPGQCSADPCSARGPRPRRNQRPKASWTGAACGVGDDPD